MAARVCKTLRRHDGTRTSRFTRTLLASSILICIAQGASAAQGSFEEITLNYDGELEQGWMSSDGEVIVAMAYGPNMEAQTYRWANGAVTPITGLKGSYFTAQDISSDGSVIVGHSGTDFNSSRAVRWAGGTMTDLGTLGGNYSFASAVSADGSVVVGRSTLAKNPGDIYITNSHAFRWENGSMVDLGALSGGGSSFAIDISADGRVTVGASENSEGSTRATRWVGTAIEDLGSLGGNWAYADVVNADGSAIAGESSLSNGSSHAFRWTAATGMEDLGTLDGGSGSEASFISADGSVVAGYANLAPHQNRVFRWTQSTGMRDIGVIAGRTDSTAYAMSANGDVIVGASYNANDTDRRAFRWSTSAGIQTVEDWLSSNGVNVNSSSVYTQSAAALNADGNVVAGELNNGHAYLARVTGSSSTTGMIDMNQYMAGVEAVKVQSTTIAMNHSDLTINGLHGNPMRGLLPTGKQSIWASGDLGRSDHNDYNGKSGVGEIGYSISLAEDIQFNVALGRTWSRQDGAFGSETTVEGTYVMPELIVRVPNTSVYTTLSALYNDGKADIDRGYLNAGVQTSSQGDTDVRSVGGRVRLDWLNAFSYGATAFTPYVSHTYLETKLDGYTETGGGFPVTWEGSKDRTNTSRLGLDAVHPLTSTVTLLGRIEGAHRYEDRSSNVEGEILGVGGSAFDLTGMDYKQNWLRVGAGAEAKIGVGTATLMLNGTTEGEDASYWLTAGYQVRF